MQPRAIRGISKPLRRTVKDGRVYLRALALAMLGALVLAGSAQAEAQVPSGGAPPSGEQAQEGTSPGGGSEQSSEGAHEGTPPGSGGEHPSEGAQEGTPPAPGGEHSSEGTTPAPASEHPAEEAPKVAPLLPGGQHPAEESTGASAPGAEHPAEEAAKAAPVAPGGEQASGGSPAGSLSSPGPPPVVQDTPSAPPAPVISGEYAQEAPMALTVSLSGAFTVGGPGAGRPSGANTGAVAAGTRHGTIATRRLGELGCQLSALAGGITHSCAAGLLGSSGSLTGAPIGLATAASLAAAATGAPPADGGHGGSGMGNAPVAPAPGPAPSGASGSMMGASGIALLTFLTLAGLLLLAAPRAMRRLRLSCQPWLTACFVLIPERPG
jgi:hypothetical protein